MSGENEACGRCGGPTPSYDHEQDLTFWGMIRTKTTTATVRSVQFMATYLRREPKSGPSHMRVDEEQRLCDPCWGLLIGRFMQGRSVPALPGKEGQ